MTVVVAAVIACLAVACGGVPDAREPAADTPERSFDDRSWQGLAPAGVELVIGARVAELASWPPVASLAQALAADPLAQLAALGERCAIGAREVESLVWLRYADGDLVVVRGRFDRSEARGCAEALLEGRGAVLEEATLRGRRLWRSAGARDPGWLIVPHDGVALVVTSRALVDRVLAGATPRLAEAPSWIGAGPQASEGAVLWALAGPASVPARVLTELGVGIEVAAIDAGLFRDGDRGVIVAVVRSATADSAAVLATLARRTLDGARESLDELGLPGLASRLELDTEGAITRARLVLEASELGALAAPRQDSRSR